MTTQETKQTILDGMARAFFACAWADACEEAGEEQMLSGREIMHVMPSETDPSAIHAAQTLIMQIESAHPGLKDIGLIFKACTLMDQTGADRTLTPELFGHYCAMQAMGTGVGLESFGRAVRDAVRVPYIEFGSHSLSLDYFTQADEAGQV